MTCIIGYSYAGRNYIACDSQGTCESGLKGFYGTKIVSNKNYAVGVCQSVRIRDIISEAEGFPKQMKTIKDVRKFRDRLKEVLIEDGASPSYTENDTTIHPFGVLIVSSYGIWKIMCDYGILEDQDGFLAIGSGQEIALGALAVYVDMTDCAYTEGEDLGIRVIDIASKFIASVGGPCYTESFKAC